MSDGKCIVKYLRLSLEDEDMLDESNSITNQRIVIGQYIASKNEFKNTEVLEFKDDGYSGTNFDRPGFQSMMELVRDGKVSTIIVKDLSRFGRNHIEVDTYLEQIFPFMNVRFIAINDNVDSMKYESGMPGIDVGFRNIRNDEAVTQLLHLGGSSSHAACKSVYLVIAGHLLVHVLCKIYPVY